MQPATIQTSLGTPTIEGVAFFLLFIAVTLGITYWAAKRTKTTAEYYAAGRSISAAQNGMALAGDYMSAATFLGISGMCAMKGFDGLIYAVGPMVGWPVLLILLAEPLRNLGKYTFADVVAYRLRQKPVRMAAAFGGITTLIFYTIAQMVGAGSLVKLMFGIPYLWAEIIVGVVIIAYVLFGGMIATTWVQIIKAALLLGGGVVLVLLTMNKFHFDLGALYSEVARQYGQTALEPGGFISSPLEAISLGLAFIFGVAGLPHILVRFYTVPDAKAARNSVFYSTGIVGFFFCIIPIVGFGASALIPRAFIGGMDRGGGNMAAPLLSEYLGNTAFLGFIAAVAFATILAVVAGLTLANASSVAHDLYNNVIKQGKATSSEQMRVAKIATLVFGALAVGLGVLFEGQNVAFMATIAFAVACSANFPALFMAIMWRRFTTQGAVASILVGAFSSLIMILLSPTVYVNVFQAAKLAAKLPVDPAPISLINPAIVTMPLAILAGVLVSLLTKDPEAIAKFDAQLARNYMGVGAE